MGIFSGDSPVQDAQPRGANGNVRDIKTDAKHAALVESPHTDASRRSDHQPKHAK